MSSVGVLIKESKCFVRKKNLSVRRKIFKVWRGGEMFKCKISGVRKKNGNWKKSSGEKKYWVEILLSLYSLVGLFMLILQVKVTEKKMEIFKVFFG